MALFQELNEQGITVLLVTHEPDVAQYAKRIVEVKDGLIRRDHPVENRRNAKDDLQAENGEPRSAAEGGTSRSAADDIGGQPIGAEGAAENGLLEEAA